MAPQLRHAVPADEAPYRNGPPRHWCSPGQLDIIQHHHHLVKSREAPEAEHCGGCDGDRLELLPDNTDTDNNIIAPRLRVSLSSSSSSPTKLRVSLSSSSPSPRPRTVRTFPPPPESFSGSSDLGMTEDPRAPSVSLRRRRFRCTVDSVKTDAERQLRSSLQLRLRFIAEVQVKQDTEIKYF